jgi:multiple sugar transport system substrate-binding protein
MAKALQTKAGAKWGISLASGGAGAFQSALPFVWSSGAALMNPAGTRWTFDTPQMAGALQYYQSFFTDGVADRNAPATAGAREAAFVDGSTPMLIDGSAEADRLYRAGGDGFSAKYAVMRIPRQQSSTSLLGGTDLVVFKQSKHRDAAWKLIQFLSQARVQLTWFKLTGNLPALRAAWQDPSLSEDAKLAVFKDQLTDVKAPPVSTAWTRISAAADTELEHLVKSGTDPATAANALQHTADTIGTGG